MSQEHTQIIGHFSLGVRDIRTAKFFYTAALAPLNLHLVYESGPDARIPTLGYGPDPDHEAVNLFQHGDAASAPGKGCHIAFNAPTRDAAVCKV
ncbi:unnamed protein product [Parascedosporium putredinis]|nr:unnamed protein product [Parascedosporium putredinis]CAI8001748.1 unnamed protein product [Parascedosporium putredinis]